ncbi:MAG: NnrU family protein [Pseudomonadota bacterium]
MALILLGLALWVSGHLWNRFLPGAYAAAGKAAYPISAVMILGALLAMVLGYRAAPYIELWPQYPWTIYVNNLLMLLAFYVYFQTTTPRGTAWVLGNLKHPQLSGFCIWGVAHIIANGHLAAVILFGGLIGWAMWEVILITKHGEKFDRSKAPIKSPWVHLALSLAVFAIVAGIHAWIGVNPFGA